ncbi:hypothetical protein [Novilysobacter spongiicola]|uniref:Uncharacterized protein n=1 Tax=Lysobacter spongiicola DSM 21749 TaxID=1122188 RepID=A0A1T4RAH1_9GAMM|nr:hypothetical protein [Lysobacter spongiicola]SKA12631.1 hypothetical protein SAMN02745674_02062 [Lysobacter spongiicola DSM 21749]
MQWILEHRESISLLVTVGTLVVWIVYLQVFLASYRRQRKPTILINLGQGRGLDAHCLVTNMSAEAIYIHALIARIEGPEGVLVCSITELDNETWSDPSEIRLWTRQGPLKAGHVRDMGSVQAIIDHAMESAPEGGRSLEPGAGRHSLELKVIAVHGSEDLLAGARRTFDIIQHERGPALRPRSYGATQIRSKRERRQMERSLADELPDVI